MPYNFKVIKIIKGTSYDVWKLEKTIIKSFSSYKPEIRFDGSSECLDINQLNEVLLCTEGEI